MYKWYGRVALITGASNSIGIEICKSLVQNGMTVCAIAKKSGIAKLEVMTILLKYFEIIFITST